MFAISVGGFAILDNHLHFLVRLDPDVAGGWSPEEVVTRWAKLHPPRHKRKPIPVTSQWIAEQVKDVRRVELLRKRLVTLGWFMKEIKEPLARLANREDKKKGTFFEGRYKSIALLDEQSILTVCAYIDLNPVAAGVAKSPESSEFASISERIANLIAWRSRSHAQSPITSEQGGSETTHFEDDLWLVPIEDRRQLGAQREGMLEGCTLESYLRLVEHTGRLHRSGKVPLSAELGDIFERLGISAELWEEQQYKLAGDELKGRFLAASQARLKAAAGRLGKHHCVNLNGCFAA